MPEVWEETFASVGQKMSDHLDLCRIDPTYKIHFDFWQVGYLRPQNRHKKYKNLYFAGASTHPGTGFPIVLLSARLTVERILLEKGTISVQNMVNAVAAATD